MGERAAEIRSDEYPLNDGDDETPAQDQLPEHCQYRDEGCELAPSCLNCPFATCIYDEPGGRQHFARRLRDKEILRLFTIEKQGVAELAALFSISQRTVQRALKRAGND